MVRVDIFPFFLIFHLKGGIFHLKTSNFEKFSFGKKKHIFTFYHLSIFCVQFSIIQYFILLYNRSLEVFILQNWKSIPLEQFPISYSSWSLKITILLSVSINLTNWHISFKWSHTVCLYDWLIPFSLMSSTFIHVVACDRIPLF